MRPSTLPSGFLIFSSDGPLLVGKASADVQLKQCKWVRIGYRSSSVTCLGECSLLVTRNQYQIRLRTGIPDSSDHELASIGPFIDVRNIVRLWAVNTFH
jgi:hypothetical protein